MNLAHLAFAAGALILAANPIAWLIHTWTDPAFDSPGPWIFALVVLLFLWSASSSLVGFDHRARRSAHVLLGTTALVRLLSHVLDVDVLGGFALVIDVYALGLLGRLAHRRRAVSPAWLALVFAFALPIERIVQRLIGYPLQWLSAAGACTFLGVLLPDVRCAGISIVAGGREVLVDVPCSGARGLVALGILFVVLGAMRRPAPVSAAIGMVVALGSAAAANLVRITLLTFGVAYAPSIPIDVMAAPWHEAIGALALAVGAIPVGTWARRAASAAPRRFASPARPAAAPRPAFALAFLALALLILRLPHRPVDASAPVQPVALPASLLGLPLQIEALDDKERVYFTRYGGEAIKARYGSFGVLAVSTTAPLRHLHAPDECLRGSGHTVRLLGTVFSGRMPSAVYRSTTPDGAVFRVAATFLSDRGDVATSISEVAWRWLQQDRTVWTALQRIVPEDTAPALAQAFDVALAAALELPSCEASISQPHVSHNLPRSVPCTHPHHCEAPSLPSAS